jgi:PAS domain S-box-containing protein
MDDSSVIDRFAGRFPAHVMRRLRTPDGAYRYLHVSPGVGRSFGLDPNALVAAKAVTHDWIHADDRARFIAALERSARDLTTLDEEVRVVLPDGGIKWVRSLGDPVRSADGSVVWDGVALDITDRREAMETVARAMDLARSAEAQASSSSAKMFTQMTPLLADLRRALGLDGAPTDIADARGIFQKIEAVLGLAGQDAQTAPSAAATLTARQREIVALIAQGRSNREIAAETGLTEGTVKLHVSGILKRTGLRNRTEIAHHALNSGLS